MVDVKILSNSYPNILDSTKQHYGSYPNILDSINRLKLVSIYSPAEFVRILGGPGT